ncbi:MAG: hypothetical protein Q9160_002638 [Pyrenula sp. 1 TL-2023]
MSASLGKKSYTFVVEHLDPELGPWSALEYNCIAKESSQASCDFILSSVDSALKAEMDAKSWAHVQVRSEGIESLYSDKKERVCLLDPRAKEELHPADGETFDVFLFGGILVPLDKIPYVDFPELKLDEHESTEMPFRYVVAANGEPVMPEGMLQLIKADADKGFDDFMPG